MTTVYVPSADGPYVRAEFDGFRILVDGRAVPRRLVAVVYYGPETGWEEAHRIGEAVQAAGYSCFVRRGLAEK
jgi:hypothetical protein